MKALVPIDATDDGVVILYNDEHLSKSPSLIYANENETKILTNNGHSEKAYFSIGITMDGIDIWFN